MSVKNPKKPKAEKRKLVYLCITTTGERLIFSETKQLKPYSTVIVKAGKGKGTYCVTEDYSKGKIVCVHVDNFKEYLG